MCQFRIDVRINVTLKGLELEGSRIAELNLRTYRRKGNNDDNDDDHDDGDDDDHKDEKDDVEV